MIDSLFNLLNSNLLIGFIILVVIIPLYVKTGVFDKLWGKNGKNGKNKEIEELKIQLSDLQDNHLHELGEKLDRLIDKMEEHNKMEFEVLFILKEVKEKLK